MKYLVSLEIDSPKRIPLKKVQAAFSADEWWMEEFVPHAVAVHVLNVVALRELKPKRAAK